MAAFLVLEGLDGAGTTTQTTRLANWLRGQGAKVLETREPTPGRVGKVIRDVLAGIDGSPAVETLPWLFAADRADHLWGDVEPALATDTYVVSDRYYASSLAYQTLTLPYSRVRALNADFRVPDLTLFLDVGVDECLRRIAERGGPTEIFERRDRMEAIHASYQAVMQHLRDEGEPIVTIDGTLPIDDVTAAIVREVEARWSSWPAS